MSRIIIEGYELHNDLFYDSEADMWVKVEGKKAKVGIDPLGLEINGTLAQLAVAELGTRVKRGEPFGSLEAEKFVGPVVSPLSGLVSAVNEDVLKNISRMHKAPYESWVIEMEMDDPDELSLLVSGNDLQPAFELRLADYRKKGVLAR